MKSFTNEFLSVTSSYGLSSKRTPCEVRSSKPPEHPLVLVAFSLYELSEFTVFCQTIVFLDIDVPVDLCLDSHSRTTSCGPKSIFFSSSLHCSNTLILYLMDRSTFFIYFVKTTSSVLTGLSSLEPLSLKFVVVYSSFSSSRFSTYELIKKKRTNKYKKTSFFLNE